ncbi:SNF2_family helicase [Hexamita inflata]|uniref:SNF2 family helicase n=1 Tax=Hexamita inflata TaxID=28002 RepID=A0AA86NKW1_9EUKA|nr:SNF2 family helicase [Hexamita inflata]CAI9930257.1 SNF2 family helicase [Hexamita inflata]CAI9930259.1 SNF2 family helicase [Hexamita inflata]
MNMGQYSYRTPQEGVQQAMKFAEEQALANVQEEHRRAYQQLKAIISAQGTQQLNDEQRQYFQQMDQYVEQARRQAIETLCQQDPNIAQYCREMENNFQRKQNNIQAAQNQIDFNSPDYHTQLRMYVQEINASNFQQLEYKLKTLYISLINKQYTRPTALQHLKNVLQSLDQIAQTLSNTERQREVRTIWQSIQMINQQEGTPMVELWDQRAMNEEDEEESMNINGQYIKSIPFTYPDDVITYMVLPVRAQLLINTKMRAGENIPSQIYIKRRKGRPSKDTGVAHDYYTPVYTNGQVDQEVMDFFGTDSPQIAQEIDNLAKTIYEQREYYMRPENRQPTMQTAPVQQFGQIGSYYGNNGGMNMFNSKRSYRRHEDSFSDYDVSDQNFSESSEFQEEELTEEEEEQLNMSDSNNISGSDQIEEEQENEDSSSGGELEDIEQDEENIIDEVIDMKIIPFEDSWKYPASLMVRPEPEDVWRFDELRPQAQKQVPRSDAGFILERTKFLEEDVDTQGEEGQDKPAESLPKDQQKCYVFLIKWRGCSHIHATWELEANVQHLSSYVKIKKFKHQFIDRQTILASEKVTQQQKEQVLDQIEETKNNQSKYLIPEKIISYRLAEDKQSSWNASIQKVLSAAKNKGSVDSDAFDGSFIKGFTDNKIHYCNADTESQLDEQGFVLNQTPGIEQFRGEMYLIKWTDLSYQGCTWELHEDLISNKYIGEEMVKNLRKNFKNAAKPIQKMLASSDVCKFGMRKAFQEFTSAKPEFLVDVNSKFELKPHQIRGVNTLLLNWSRSRNMILADHKDQGKTVQAIAFMSALTHQYCVPGPFLIVAPVNSIPAWQESLANWFPDATIVSLVGSKEDRRMIIDNELLMDNNTHRFHVMLTTPTVALIEESNLKKFKWRMMCIDEAHQLKDREGKRNRLFTEFSTDAKLLITSTPVQSSVQELYNLLHFVDPDQFHTADIFNKFGQLEHYREAIKQCEIVSEDGEKLLMKENVIPMQSIQSHVKDSEEQAQDAQKMIISDDDDDDLMPTGGAPADMTATYAGATIHNQAPSESSEDKIRNIVNCIKPYILRRDPNLIDKSTPGKTEYVMHVNMTKMQEQYMKYILELNQTTLKYSSSESSKLSNVLVQLKKVCNHPFMFKDTELPTMTIDDIVNNSGKMQALDQLLAKFKQEGHKVIIYTQMLKTMTILQRYCELKQYKFDSLLGSNSIEARARAIGNFNRADSDSFIFLLNTRQGRQGVNLQTANRVVIFDTDFNAQLDLVATGRVSKNQTQQVEIYRLVTKDSVEEQIMEISKRKLVLDSSMMKSNTDFVQSDSSILKHVIEYGSRPIFDNQLSQAQSFDQMLAGMQKLNYQNLSEAERMDIGDAQFSDFKNYSETFWASQFPEQHDDSYEPGEYMGQLSKANFDSVCKVISEFGSWRFADKVQGMSQDDAASAIYSVIKQAKQVASEFGVDIFNLPQQLQFNYQSNSGNAVPILKAYFKMFLIEQHVKNDRFRLPKNFFEIPDFANAWGYVQDVRLLIAAKHNGLFVSKFSKDLLDKLVCDGHITKLDCTVFLQQRLDLLTTRLQSISSTSLMEKLNEDGLHTNVQFDNTNDQHLDEKETELVRRFEQSGCLFPIIKDLQRTTFQIELQQKMFKQCYSQLQKFFNQDRKERVAALFQKFYNFGHLKLHFDEFRGVSTTSGIAKLKKRFLSMWEKFETSSAEDNLLFKIYIQILNIVYSKMPIIICQCDEHILQLKQRIGALAEIDNDSLINEYVKDLFDYLYRQLWVICDIKMFPTPYILARMCEYNALAFDEEDFEFGVDNEDYFVILRKEKGVKNAVVEDGNEDEDMGLNESY